MSTEFKYVNSENTNSHPPKSTVENEQRECEKGMAWKSQGKISCSGYFVSRCRKSDNDKSDGVCVGTGTGTDGDRAVVFLLFNEAKSIL